MATLRIKITGSLSGPACLPACLNQVYVKSIIAKITGICQINHLSATIIRRRRRSGKTFIFINGSIFVVASSEMFLEMLSEHSSGQKDEKKKL